MATNEAYQIYVKELSMALHLINVTSNDVNKTKNRDFTMT